MSEDVEFTMFPLKFKKERCSYTMKIDMTMTNVTFGDIHAETVHVSGELESAKELIEWITGTRCGEANVDDYECDCRDVHPLNYIDYDCIDFSHLVEFCASVNSLLKSRGIKISDNDDEHSRQVFIARIIQCLLEDDLMGYLAIEHASRMTDEMFDSMLDIIYGSGVETGFFMV